MPLNECLPHRDDKQRPTEDALLDELLLLGAVEQRLVELVLCEAGRVMHVSFPRRDITGNANAPITATSGADHAQPGETARPCHLDMRHRWVSARGSSNTLEGVDRGTDP